MSKKLFKRLISKASQPVPKEQDKQRHPDNGRLGFMVATYTFARFIFWPVIGLVHFNYARHLNIIICH
jgi:hypothetical protein